MSVRAVAVFVVSLALAVGPQACTELSDPVGVLPFDLVLAAMFPGVCDEYNIGCRELTSEESDAILDALREAVGGSQHCDDIIDDLWLRHDSKMFMWDSVFDEGNGTLLGYFDEDEIGIWSTHFHNSQWEDVLATLWHEGDHPRHSHPQDHSEEEFDSLYEECENPD